MKILNGSVPFMHPVTGQLIEPYQWYDGFAHLDHEEGLGLNNTESADETEPDASEEPETADEEEEEYVLPINRGKKRK